MFPLKFIHLADLHLGKRQYGIPERYEDYFKAFDWILNKAIVEEVDFILIAGDFIDSEKKINPSTLRDIIRSIQHFHSKSKEQLKRTIPIICIEGNHETPFFSDHTWLRLLSDLDLIILLSSEYDVKTNALKFDEYSQDTHKGGKVSLKGATIYGINWYGSSTKDLFPLISKEIEKDDKHFNILMMHFGIESYDKRKTAQVDTSTQLFDLHESIDYLALGHYHVQYTIPDSKPWIFNPGSLEINEITEYNQDRGAIMVEVFSSESDDFSWKPILCQNGYAEGSSSIPNRSFSSISSIDICETKSFEEAVNLVISQLRKRGVPVKSDEKVNKKSLDIPVLYFAIEGDVEYSPLEIDLGLLKDKIRENFDILDIKLINNVFSLSQGGFLTGDGEEDGDGLLKIEEIEKKLLELTIQGEQIFEPHKEKIVDLILTLKSELTSNPDYKIIKKDLANWFNLNSEVQEEFLKIIRSQIKKKKPRKRSKKAPKKKQPEIIVEEEWSEKDFEEEFDFEGLLDDDDSIDEMDDEFLDEMIDDEDLEL